MSVSIIYRVFLLYIEPLSTIIGAFYAHFLPRTYLELTHAPSAPASNSSLPTSTTVVLTQLANLYFLFAINEGLVLRATNDLKVWRILLFGLLLADFGHLYSVHELGHQVYWQFWTWNAMDCGNVGFVYLGAAIRIAFLSGVGIGAGTPMSSGFQKQKSP
ncbi:hypothetical protein EJ08DRAFT_658386 [Tothia fuscella]|uniref:DUF7704 domain-containing protein n=1 Tax=Tothia fuscella TaxID=1048955 RepID=A0A9P4NWW4_9PEZI|nr:hypothetical protein EJ08DRAFT_658386 [Tothia fuscella]